jgi:hypothetical protein
VNRPHLLVVPLLACLAGCFPRTAPALPEPVQEPEAVVEPFPYAIAWTRGAERAIRPVEGELPPQAVRDPFTRLNVLAVEPEGIRVRCLYCIPAVEGWIDRDDLVFEPLDPTEAAGRGLAEFVLAVRAAVERRDEAALGRVMSRDFTFSLQGGGGPIDAFRRWEFQGFRSLDNLPALLDRGIATRDSVIWVAPPSFLTDPGFQGLRAGFRENPAGRWEWIFLVE